MIDTKKSDETNIKIFNVKIKINVGRANGFNFFNY